MARHKDSDWNLPDNSSWECVNAALLMDLRDELRLMRQELQKVNNVLQCTNTIRIPRKLDRIARAADKLREKLAPPEPKARRA